MVIPDAVRTVTRELSIPVEANDRYAGLSLSEIRSDRGCRVIGGDKGDLWFDGYEVARGKTIIYKPCVYGFSHDFQEWDADEVDDLAEEILLEAFESVGVECVEHS